MDNKLFNSELKVMEVLWDGGDKSAKEISDILAKEIGWNKNTTYTVIKKCIAKQAITKWLEKRLKRSYQLKSSSLKMYPR